MKNIIKLIISVAVSVITFLWMNSIEFKPSKLNIDVDAEFIRADRFQLFYSFDSIPQFVEKESINYLIKAKQKEIIEFEVPLDDKILTTLRFDISSSNYEQKPIKINSIVLKTKKSKVVFEKNIKDFFKSNEYIVYNKKGKFETKLVNKKYDPYLLFDANGELLEELTQKQSRFTTTRMILFSFLSGVLVFLLVSAVIYAFKKSK
ncbi:hypothetical protein M0D21_17205 [Aquimarina sp. D1M17]|uniref:hypothetical protein n=1 Tax=Aquimarina acroporae TaxID=2937283 RepID=UPI0020BD5362|nr:hypothetical protein [Aquimarina acroporae]MCK8523322.1 hypothetical protein [Aquimarina acroporae]